MPSRKKKMPRANASSTGVRPRGHEADLPIDRLALKRFSPTGTHTRINAFVTSLGRRNQAKRDAR